MTDEERKKLEKKFKRARRKFSNDAVKSKGFVSGEELESFRVEFLNQYRKKI